MLSIKMSFTFSKIHYSDQSLEPRKGPLETTHKSKSALGTGVQIWHCAGLANSKILKISLSKFKNGNLI